MKWHGVLTALFPFWEANILCVILRFSGFLLINSLCLWSLLYPMFPFMFAILLSLSTLCYWSVCLFLPIFNFWSFQFSALYRQKPLFLSLSVLSVSLSLSLALSLSHTPLIIIKEKNITLGQEKEGIDIVLIYEIIANHQYNTLQGKISHWNFKCLDECKLKFVAESSEVCPVGF